ncbi:MAG: hypothetical protein JXB05_13130, partial [Myxococcaceae bacterium]|nr:hypothetical protein [Myxococcaceae bacterium]
MAAPVLLVHDDIATIATVRRLLSREGYEVILATSVADALIAFGHHLPALLILAPGVEGGRGHLVLEELAQHPEGHQARVLLLGEPLPGHSVPVAPLPLEVVSFIQSVSALVNGPAQAEDWRVMESHTFPAPHAAPPADADPWQVPPPSERSNPALVNALFGTPVPLAGWQTPMRQEPSAVSEQEQVRAQQASQVMDAAFEQTHQEVEAAAVAELETALAARPVANPGGAPPAGDAFTFVSGEPISELEAMGVSADPLFEGPEAMSLDSPLPADSVPATLEPAAGVDFSGAEEITVQDPSAVGAALELAPAPVLPDSTPAEGFDEDELRRLEEEVRLAAAERRRQKLEVPSEPVAPELAREPSTAEHSAPARELGESFVTVPAEEAFSLSEEGASSGAEKLRGGGWMGIGAQEDAADGSVEAELRAEAERMAQLEGDAALSREQAELAQAGTPSPTAGEAAEGASLPQPAAAAPRLGDASFFDVEEPSQADESRARALEAAEAELRALRGESEPSAPVPGEAGPPVAEATGEEEPSQPVPPEQDRMERTARWAQFGEAPSSMQERMERTARWAQFGDEQGATLQERMERTARWAQLGPPLPEEVQQQATHSLQWVEPGTAPLEASVSEELSAQQLEDLAADAIPPPVADDLQGPPVDEAAAQEEGEVPREDPESREIMRAAKAELEMEAVLRLQAEHEAEVERSRTESLRGELEREATLRAEAEAALVRAEEARAAADAALAEAAREREEALRRTTEQEAEELKARLATLSKERDHEARLRAEAERWVMEFRGREAAIAKVRAEEEKRRKAMESEAEAARAKESQFQAQDEELARFRAQLAALQKEASEQSRLRAELEARVQEESRKRREAEAQAEITAQAQAEAEARAEAEAQRRAEAEARAETAAQAQAEAESRATRARAEIEARVSEEELARFDAQVRADAEALARSQAEARASEEEQKREEIESRLQREAKARAATESRVSAALQARAEAEARAEEEARARQEAEARAEAEQQARAEAEARAEEEARARQEAEARAEE